MRVVIEVGIEEVKILIADAIHKKLGELADPMLINPVFEKKNGEDKLVGFEHVKKVDK